MKTDDLIRGLVADRPSLPPPVGRFLALVLLPACALSAFSLVLTLGLRPDLAAASVDPRFLMKLVVTLALAASAGALVLRLARPGAATRLPALMLALAPAVLAVQVAAELVLVPRSMWSGKLLGANALACLVAVPLFALPLLAAVLIALRRAAPTRPALAGAIAGLFAGGLGAALYVMHCPDDSPLFVATWYGLAIMIVAAAGTVAGRRLLRW